MDNTLISKKVFLGSMHHIQYILYSSQTSVLCNPNLILRWLCWKELVCRNPFIVSSFIIKPDKLSYLECFTNHILLLRVWMELVLHCHICLPNALSNGIFHKQQWLWYVLSDKQQAALVLSLFVPESKQNVNNIYYVNNSSSSLVMTCSIFALSLSACFPAWS